MNDDDNCKINDGTLEFDAGEVNDVVGWRLAVGLVQVTTEWEPHSDSGIAGAIPMHCGCWILYTQGSAD